MTAREFVLVNSDKFREAVENGLDIRMDEDEIFFWMQKFRDAAPKNMILCPKCLGEGIVPFNGFSTSSVSANRSCPVCNGDKIFFI